MFQEFTGSVFNRAANALFIFRYFCREQTLPGPGFVARLA